MDELIKLFKRMVEAMEKQADALAEMNAEGIAVVLTNANAEVKQDPKPADEEQTDEEQTDEEQTGEEQTGDDDDLGGGEAEEEKEVDQAMVRAAVRAYAAKNGEPKAIALMKKYGGKAEKISAIKPQFFKAVYDAATA